jgi:hypothetical protein
VKLQAIKIKIIDFIDDHQPGWVECKFTDAWDKEHTVQDKVPIVTAEDLDANSEYPREGVIAFELVRSWKDKDGRTIYTVNTGKPWGVQTIEGLTEFDILKDQVIELKH